MRDDTGKELTFEGEHLYYQGARKMLMTLRDLNMLCYNPRDRKDYKEGKGTHKQADALYYDTFFKKLLDSRGALEAFMGGVGEEIKPSYYTDSDGYVKCEMTTSAERMARRDFAKEVVASALEAEAKEG